MSQVWAIQGSDRRERCMRCGVLIRPFTYFFRAVTNLDLPEFDMDYDVCFSCRRSLPTVPPAKSALLPDVGNQTGPS